MSEWLVRGLARHAISAVLMETRQAHKVLSAMTIKTRCSIVRFGTPLVMITCAGS